MMICWDVHFPEVARNLCADGAEVIAMPIWGGNPTLAKARAIENQIYLVSSTYTELSRGKMVSGIWDPEGRLLAQNGPDWGQVLVTEVDLARRIQWHWLGDFKARIERERPAGGFRD
jgi:predicted amidohydrolase